MCSRDGGYVFIILEAPCSLTTILSTSSNSRDQGLVGSDGGPFSSTKCLCKPFFFSQVQVIFILYEQKTRGCDWSSQKESRTF